MHRRGERHGGHTHTLGQPQGPRPSRAAAAGNTGIGGRAARPRPGASPAPVATTDAATTHLPEREPVADTEGGPARLESAGHQRPAKIDRRLAETHQAEPGRPGDDPAPQAGWDVRECTQEAPGTGRSPLPICGRCGRCGSVQWTRLAGRQVRMIVPPRCMRGQSGPESAAWPDTSAGLRFTRAAAQASRQRAREIHDRAVDPARESPKATAV